MLSGPCLVIDCARALHETLFVPILLYGSETMIWREKKIFMTRAVQMDRLRVLMSIRKIDRETNAQIRVMQSEEGSRWND